MVVGMFPIAKLGYLALRQISKPIANTIKGQAKRSAFFRDKVCVPPAQLYHYWETVIKMRMYGLGKPDNVKQLNVEAAVELGADMLGEMVVFAVGAFALLLEYRRQATNTAQREQSQFQRITELERRVELLQTQVESMQKNASTSTLQRITGFLKRSPDATQPDAHGETSQSTEALPPVEGVATGSERRSESEPNGKGEKPESKVTKDHGAKAGSAAPAPSTTSQATQPTAKPANEVQTTAAKGATSNSDTKEAAKR